MRAPERVARARRARAAHLVQISGCWRQYSGWSGAGCERVIPGRLVSQPVHFIVKYSERYGLENRSMLEAARAERWRDRLRAADDVIIPWQ
jgi:hypothetical protein